MNDLSVFALIMHFNFFGYMKPRSIVFKFESYFLNFVSVPFVLIHKLMENKVIDYYENSILFE